MVAMFAACLAARAVAAPPPPTVTPGAIGNEQQRQQQQIENQQPSPQTAPQESPVVGPSSGGSGVPAAPGISFVLTGVTFDNSSFLAPDELQAIAQPYVGKTVSFDDLAAIVAKVNALYKAKGQVTARAILPPQKIQNGVVHIALVEGKLGKIDVVGARHMSEDYVRDRIAVPPGAVIDVKALTDAVVYFNRTNDAQVRALLKPGSAFGETDVELDLTEPPPDAIQIFVDNEGVDSTGKEEAGLYYKHTNLFFDGDRTTVYGTVSRGGIDGTVSYGAPFDTSGDRADVSYERNHIDIIHGQFNGLAIHGSGETANAGVTMPLVASREWLITAELAGAYGTSRTVQTSGVVSDTATYREIGTLSITYIDPDLLAALNPSFAYAESHNAILKKDEDFSLFTGQGTAIVPFARTWSIHLNTAWQYSPQSLLPPDLLFQIGGPTSVRGYPSGTYAGDSGFYANAELHHEFTDISRGLDMFVFYDAGMVFSTSPPHRSLDAVGLGASYSPNQAVTISASVGIPLMQANPGQDGYQFYLQLAGRL